MISSFEDLLERSIANRTFTDALLTGIANFERYRAAMPLIPGSYARTLLRKTGDFELVAMQWAAGAQSPIHDHGDSRCWVVVLEGVLDVDNYERLDDGLSPHARIAPASQMRLAPQQLDHRFDWRELHRVRNATPQSVYSLQLYAGPQTEYTVIDEATMLCRRASPAYDSTFEL